MRGQKGAQITINGGSESLNLGKINAGQTIIWAGGANTGKVTVDSIGLWGNYHDDDQKVHGADVVIDGTRGITVNQGVAVTMKSKLQLGTENNKGDVQIGLARGTVSVSVDNESTAAITAGGKISTAGDLRVYQDSAVSMRGAAIDINGFVDAASTEKENDDKAPQISLISEDSTGKRGDVYAHNMEVDNQGRITVKGDAVTIDDSDSKAKWKRNHSIDATSGSSVSVDSNALIMNKGVFFQGGGEMNLTGNKKVIIGIAGDNPGQSIHMDNGSLFVGGNEAETTLNGSVFMEAGAQKQNSAATIDGNIITINASVMPDQIKKWGDYETARAIYAQDTKLTIGHEGTSSTTINGNLFLGKNNVAIYGKDKVAINGYKGKSDDKHAPVLQTSQPVHLTIGEADTKQTSLTGSLFLGASGNEIAIAGQNVILDNADNDLMYAYNSKNVRIGSDFSGNTSENTVLKGTVKVSGLDKEGQFGIHGKNIIWSNGAEGDPYIESGVKSHDAFVAVNGDSHPFIIGDDDSNVSIDGRVLSLSGGIDVNGRNIHIYEGTNKNQYVVLTHTNRINLGGDTTENLQLDGGFCAQGYADGENGSALKGKNIVINAADGHNALLSLSQKVTVGGEATDYLGINGEVFSHGSAAPISMQGRNVVITGKGEDEALLYTTGGQLDVDGDVIAVDGTQTKYAAEVNGGSMTIGHDGTHGMIKGNLDNYGSMKVSLNGADSVIHGNIQDWCLEHPEGGEMGGVVLNLKDGAQWHFDGDSTVNTLNAANGRIYFDPASTSQKLTTHSFAGEGGMLQLNSTGTSHDNDRLYVIGSHTGKTALQLHSLNNGKWTDGALGSILASVGEEKGSFYVPDTEDRLFFHHTELGRYETSKGDKVTPRYNTDWYLKGFTKSETDDDGHHTHVVRELAGLHNVNYQI